jgi:ABC-type sulfate transport system permease subunit
MNPHKYLRAYMAGIVVPTIVLLIAVAAFSIARYAYHFSEPLERLMIFPMSVVPNVWGLWNMLFLASRSRTRLSVGFHGALLPALLIPGAYLLTRFLDFSVPDILLHLVPVGAVAAFIAYYLLWKYVVGFLNGVLGIG